MPTDDATTMTTPPPADAAPDVPAPATGPRLAQGSVSRTGRPLPEGPRPSAEETEILFEKAVRDDSRRLLAIARAIVGNRASPEDVVQQAVLNLYRHRARYDWREPGGLLKRAVVNEALRLLRQNRPVALVEETAVGTDAERDDPQRQLVASETTLRVRAAVAELPEHFRAALVLCEYENMSYAEIAQTLGASVPQVKTWIHRARRKLEAKLQDYVRPKD